jgi:hypothetical protein
VDPRKEEDESNMGFCNVGILPHPSLKMKAALTSETLVSYDILP